MAIVVTSWLTDEGFLAQLFAGLGRNLILLMLVVVFVIGTAYGAHGGAEPGGWSRNRVPAVRNDSRGV
jgi:hypothetical protein